MFKETSIFSIYLRDEFMLLRLNPELDVKRVILQLETSETLGIAVGKITLWRNRQSLDQLVWHTLRIL